MKVATCSHLYSCHPCYSCVCGCHAACTMGHGDHAAVVAVFTTQSPGQKSWWHVTYVGYKHKHPISRSARAARAARAEQDEPIDQGIMHGAATC